VVRHGDVRKSREGRAPSREAEERVALRRVEVVRTYLTLDDPSQLKPSKAVAGARVVKRAPCPIPVYRRLYKEVGEKWNWHERAKWSDEQLSAQLAKPTIAVWELMVGDESAGYFELERHDDGAVEIVYFGLVERYIGRGLGGFMLARAVEEGFAAGAPRVWLHTCTLDSEHALPGYLARGFRKFKQERYYVDFDGETVVEQHTPHASTAL
jgi:GNAT superfamily N-acetyltransferase